MKLFLIITEPKDEKGQRDGTTIVLAKNSDEAIKFLKQENDFYGDDCERIVEIKELYQTTEAGVLHRVAPYCE